METFNDLDLIFQLVDILVLVAGVFAVAAWYVDYRRHAQRVRLGRRWFGRANTFTSGDPDCRGSRVRAD
jgi:hypothetical protein